MHVDRSVVLHDVKCEMFFYIFRIMTRQDQRSCDEMIWRTLFLVTLCSGTVSAFVTGTLNNLEDESPTTPGVTDLEMFRTGSDKVTNNSPATEFVVLPTIPSCSCDDSKNYDGLRTRGPAPLFLIIVIVGLGVLTILGLCCMGLIICRYKRQHGNAELPAIGDFDSGCLVYDMSISDHQNNTLAEYIARTPLHKDKQLNTNTSEQTCQKECTMTSSTLNYPEIISDSDSFKTIENIKPGSIFTDPVSIYKTDNIYRNAVFPMLTVNNSNEHINVFI